MKRFYCTICKRVKRARKFPRKFDSTLLIDGEINNHSKPEKREGICNRHIFRVERLRIVGR